MSPAFTTRRRAEEFDRLVESTRSGIPVTGPVPADLTELAAFATALSAAPEIAPRPAFAAELRERLMAAAATELAAPADAVTDRLTVRHNPARRRHERRITIGIASLAIVGASAGTALASQSALPGQPLYPVKRAIENVRTGFTPGDSGKGSAILGDADTRLDEVTQLSRDSDGNAAEIAKTLDAFAEQAKKASDLLLSNYQQDQDAASIEKLHAFASDSIDQLAELEPLLPAAAKDALANAAQAVLMIDSAASNLCPSCAGNPIISLPETLLDSTASTIDDLAKALTPKTTGVSTKSSSKTPSTPAVPADDGATNVIPSLLPTLPAIGNIGGQATSQGKTSTKSTSKPDVGGVVKGVGGTVKGVTDGLGSSVGGPVGETVKGVGDTVDGVTNGVGDLLGGLLGTNPTPSP
jgi:hypothetical protein